MLCYAPSTADRLNTFCVADSICFVAVSWNLFWRDFAFVLFSHIATLLTNQIGQAGGMLTCESNLTLNPAIEMRIQVHVGPRSAA